MKTRIASFVFIVVLFNMTSYAQQITPKTAFLEKWENTKTYTLAVAEAMPEDVYSFKPTERQMTFAEQLLHIKSNMDWLSQTYFKAPVAEGQETISKQQIIMALTASFDRVTLAINSTADSELPQTVEFFAGPKSKLQILNLLQDHVTHHRGQLLVYLNLNEVTPPRYVGW